MNVQNKKEKIVVVGYGWIGQANALALVKTGYRVAYFDTAETPAFHYVEGENEYDSVQRVSSLEEWDSDNTWFIVCVGDRVSEEREQDISLIRKACDSLRNLRGKVILRSTVLPQKLKELYFHLYVPEFLHEKNAVDECLNPYFFVIGLRDSIQLPSFLNEWKRRAYKTFNGTPEEASYIKYISNLWNTIRIAFVNEIGDSIAIPSNQSEVQKIERILNFVFERKSYLRYGQGFDGHCLPKDTRAFIGAHQKEGKNLDMLIGAYSSNNHHKEIQAMYQTLPKIYSFWDNNIINKGFASKIWRIFNENESVKSVRTKLRFLVDWVTRLFPERSLERAISIWESKAMTYPLYYSNTRTRSGFDVTEKELCETGKKDYEELVESDPLLADVLSKSDISRALDFGSGVGRMTVYFANHFREVTGIDVSSAMIERARMRVQDDAVSFTAFDGKNLPFTDNHFDFIFSFQTLQHIPTKDDVDRYFAEFFRVLRKGGVAKIQLRGGRGVKRFAWSYGVSFTPEEALALAEKNGFTVLNHQVIGVKNIWLTLSK